MELNEKAALHWLSNLSLPWLLIIDNADGPDLKLADYFPRGNRGHVLVTTRDPGKKAYGNAGDGFFEFHGLSSSDASCLLLKSSGQSKPWDSVVSNIALAIAKALGYLALAITHAGRAIREEYCKLSEYLAYYERQWEKTRQNRLPVKNKDAADELSVFSTFELNREAIEGRATQASKDALQLLDTFAFFHNQDIRFDLLKRAIENAKVEHLKEMKDKENDSQAKTVKYVPDWSTWCKDTALLILAYLYKNRSPPVLPDVGYTSVYYRDPWGYSLIHDRLSGPDERTRRWMRIGCVSPYGSSLNSRFWLQNKTPTAIQCTLLCTSGHVSDLE